MPRKNIPSQLRTSVVVIIFASPPAAVLDYSDSADTIFSNTSTKSLSGVLDGLLNSSLYFTFISRILLCSQLHIITFFPNRHLQCLIHLQEDLVRQSIRARGHFSGGNVVRS